MSITTKYLSIGLGAIAVVLLIYCLLLRNDRDNALNKLDSLNTQLDTAVTANINLQTSINSLEKEQEKNRAYIASLENQKAITSKLALEELERFKNAKRTHQIINNWADVKLPSGLY